MRRLFYKAKTKQIKNICKFLELGFGSSAGIHAMQG
jgi:hypothetical protein